MNPELLLKFMSQDDPWAFGLRITRPESDEVRNQVGPIEEMPFFASKGPHGHQFTVIGDDLEECLQNCLDHPLMAEIVEKKEG